VNLTSSWRKDLIDRFVTVTNFDSSIVVDVEGLFKIFQEWNREYNFDRGLFEDSLERLESNNSKLFVARIDGTIVGYIQVTRRLQLGFSPFLEVDQVLVTENYKRKGIGRQLMKEAELFAKNSGLFIVRLESELPRSSSHVFYECLGYRMTKASKFYEKTIPR
jgi:GNAT superfamily N-acetyltransferase